MPEPRPYLLLIDDDPDDLEMLGSALEHQGLRTRKFESGEKALHFMNLISDTGRLPSMIILDYNMWQFNGMQVLIQLKKTKAFIPIPVVLYSTTISPIFKQTLIDLGAQDCFIKPVRYAEFEKQVTVFRDIAFSISPSMVTGEA